MANRFWVGGAGTWDTTSTANWSTSTGGASGASAPGVADAAIFDANSGGGAVVLGENVSCLTLNMSAFTGSLDYQTFKITLVGNATTIFTGGVGYSVSGTPLIEATYAGSTGTRIINMGATTEANAVSVNITAGSDLVGISSGSAVKNLNFTGFSGQLSNVVGRTYYGNLIYSAAMTLASGTSAQTFAATSGTQQITTNGKTLDFPITKNGAGTLQLQDNLTLGATRGFTLTAGTLELNNNTLTANFFGSSNTNTRSVAFGTGNITVTGNSATIWTTNAATNFSVTGTPVVNATYAGATGTRTFTVGNAGEANAISFNISAGTDSLAFGTSSGAYKNLNLTGFAGTTATVTGSILIFGNLTLPAGITFSSVTASVSFRATSGSQTATTNGVTLDVPITVNAPNATVSFADSLTQGATRTLTFTAGTIQLKDGVTSTVGNFVTSGTNQKFLQSTTPGSQATLSKASGTVNAQYLTIRDINATGGATWNAFVDQGNIDAGNNDGWDFGISPIVGGNEYTYQLRSFTQPRRF